MKQKGFSIIEILVVLALMTVLISITLVAFVSSRKNESLKSDTETVVQILQQARSQTISSKNASSYGVNFATSSLTLFPGTTYSSSNSANLVTALTKNTTISTTLPGGTSALVFNRITGEINQSSTVTIVVSNDTSSTTIKVYKTGIIERTTQ